MLSVTCQGKHNYRDKPTVQKHKRGAPGGLSWWSLRLSISAQVTHNLTVHGIKPRIGLCTSSMEPA